MPSGWQNLDSIGLAAKILRNKGLGIPAPPPQLKGGGAAELLWIGAHSPIVLHSTSSVKVVRHTIGIFFCGRLWKKVGQATGVVLRRPKNAASQAAARIASEATEGR